MPSKSKELSPRIILTAVFLVFLGPFLLVMLFPAQLDTTIDKGSYLAFHNVAEFFSIMVSLSVFSVGWYTYDQSRDRHALFLGTAFLAVGLLDFMHTMANAAMPGFITANSTNKSTQFWIAARLLDSAALLISAFVYPASPGRWLSKTVLMSVALSVSGLVFTGVTFFPEYLPATAVPGVGLTPLKRVLEFVVILFLIAATASYWRRLARTGNRRLIYYLAAFIIGIFSEGVFASYKTGFDTYNVLGHIYKVVAFYLIYKGVFIASVKDPYTKLVDLTGQLQATTVSRDQLSKEVEERIWAEMALTQARDELEERVKKRTLELEQANQTLKTEIGVRHRAEAEIRKLNQELEQRVMERTTALESVNQQLETFIYSISHDMRSPVRTIAGFAQILRQDYAGVLDDPGKDFLARIERGADKANRLIEDLLHLSRISRQEFAPAKIELSKIASATVAEWSEVDGEGRVEVDIRPGLWATADRRMMEIVFANLIGNAWKFTAKTEKARIEFGAIEQDKNIYYVRDNGAGFDPDYKDKMFGPFQRLHADSEFEGTGIGLTIVERIIHRHDGRVWADGEIGKGATIYFTLGE